jgi:hypothetical protein
MKLNEKSKEGNSFAELSIQLNPEFKDQHNFVATLNDCWIMNTIVESGKMIRPTFELVGSVLKIKMSHNIPNQPSEEILGALP